MKKIFIISLLCLVSCLAPWDDLFASYEPVDGRITYLAGPMISTNFQETLFSNSDSVSKPGRSQSFGVLIQALGDLNRKSSLMAEVTLGQHKFLKHQGNYVDEYKLEAITFDLGYRRSIGGNFWASIQLGSMYPWKVTQDVSLSPPYDLSEFDSIYSTNLGIQYEGELFEKPVSYDLKIRKYMSGKLDDQMAVGFSLGWRWGMD